MIVSLLLFLVALAGLAVTLVLPDWSALLIPAAAVTLLTLAVFLATLSRRRKTGPDKPETRNWILVDGSNVMFWHEETPRIDTVRAVVRHMEGLGHAVAVVFDANAGYLVAGRYLNDHAFAHLLGLPGSQVLVVPKGTPADLYLLEFAARHHARIVTNDRYRDWIKDHPILHQSGQLIQGGFRAGALWLKLPEN